MNIRRWLAAVTATSALAVLGASGSALASDTATSSTTGQIKACYPSAGKLAPLDHITSGTCPTGDKTLLWNKTGPQGPAGISQGVAGTSAAPVALDQAGVLTPVLSAGAVPVSGVYYLNASIMLVVAQGDTVTCTMTVNGGEASVFGTVGPVPNQTYQTVPLSASVDLSQGSTVQVSCADYTSNAATSFYDGSINGTLITSTSDGPRQAGVATHTRHQPPRL